MVWFLTFLTPCFKHHTYTPTCSAEIFHKNHFHFSAHERLSSRSLSRLCCAAGSEGPLRPLNAGSSCGHSGLERRFWNENINQQHFSRLRRCLWRGESMRSLRSYCVTGRKWLFMWEIFCRGSIWCVIALHQAAQYLFCSSVDVEWNHEGARRWCINIFLFHIRFVVFYQWHTCHVIFTKQVLFFWTWPCWNQDRKRKETCFCSCVEETNVFLSQFFGKLWKDTHISKQSYYRFHIKGSILCKMHLTNNG